MTMASLDSGKICIVLLLASTTLAKPCERNLEDSARGRILQVQDLSGAPPIPHHVARRSTTTADERIRGLSDTLAALQKSGELSKMAASLPAGSLQVIRKLAVPLLDTMLAEQENPAEGAATMSLERNLHAIQERASSSLRQSFAHWNLFPRFHLVSHKNITFGPLFLKKDLEIGSPEETVITPPPKAPETIPTPAIVAPSPEQEVRVTTPPPVVVTPVPTVASSLVPGETPPKTAPGPPRKVCTKQVAHMQNSPQLATITATIANEHIASSPPRVVVSAAPPAIDAVPEGLDPTETADSITKLTPIPIVPEFTPPPAVVISETSPPASESEDPATFSTAGFPTNPISELPEKPVVPESTSPAVVVTSGITPPATASPITPISVVPEFPSESSAVPGPKQPNKVCTSQQAVVQKSPTVTLIPTAEVVVPAMKPAIVAAPETSAPTVVAGPINGLTTIPVVPEPTPPPVVVFSEKPPASAIPKSPVHVESSLPSVIPPVSAPATISAIESEEHTTFPAPGVLVPAVTPSIVAATESPAKPTVPESTFPAVVVTAGNSPPASASLVTPASVVPVLPSDALPVTAIEAPKRVCTSQRATVLNSPPGATVPAITPAVIAAAAETAAPPMTDGSASEAAPIPTVFDSKEPPVVSIAETTPLASTKPSAPGGGVPVVQSVSLPVPASEPSKRVCTNQQAIVSNPATVTPTLKIKSNEQATLPISGVGLPAVNPAIIAASETSAPPVTTATDPTPIPTPQEAVISDISPLESTSLATPVSVVNGAVNVSPPVSASKTPKKVCTKQRTVAQNSPPVATIPATESKENNTVPPPQVAVIAVAPVVSATPVTSAPPVDTHPVTEPSSVSAALDSTTAPAAIIPEATPPVNALPLQPVSAVPVAAAQSLGKVCTNQVAVV